MVHSRPCRGSNELARRAFGDPISANMVMLGYALQMGALPLSPEAMEQAIRLNGADVAATLRAFRLGRLYFAEPETVESLLSPDKRAVPMAPKPVDTLQERIAVRVDALQSYQDAAYAERFRDLVERVRSAEYRAAVGSIRLTEVVVRNAFRLMAYEDEYEVARLLTGSSFWEDVRRRFDGGALKLHLAPPIFFGWDPASGRPRKRRFSAKYLLPALRLLARGKMLRGSVLDPSAGCVSGAWSGCCMVGTSPWWTRSWPTSMARTSKRPRLWPLIQTKYEAMVR
jgi:indolepyruvate ferredoxin oxidoreductase